MEITAAIMGLGGLNAPHFIWLVSDSAYMLNTIKNKWYEKWTPSRKNWDLWELMIELINFHHIVPVKVKGHTGNKYNEMVDKYASEARKELIVT